MDDQEVDGLLEMVRGSSSLHRRFQNLLARLEPDARRLARFGWTLPMWATPSDMLIVARTTSARSLDTYFLRMYSDPNSYQYRSLVQTLRQSPQLRPWRAVLREVLRAYDRRLYRVVIPTALAVLEGALVNAVDQSKRRTDPKKLAANEHAQASPGIESLAWASIDEFAARLYEYRAFQGRAPRRLNRHWVHHGRMPPRGSRADALRLLHALHTIACAKRPARRSLLGLVRDPRVRELLAANGAA